MMAQRYHEIVTREVVNGGMLFTCQQCGASVSVPHALVLQWSRADRVDDEIEPRLTRSLLLRAHLPIRAKAGKKP